MNTLYSLCDGDLLKIPAILELPYGEVFLKLYHDTEVAKFQDRYRAVVNQEK